MKSSLNVNYPRDLPLHDDQQTAMAHEDVLINVSKADDVITRACPPVEVHFTSRLRDITKDLVGGRGEGVGGREGRGEGGGGRWGGEIA